MPHNIHKYQPACRQAGINKYLFIKNQFQNLNSRFNNSYLSF